MTPRDHAIPADHAIPVHVAEAQAALPVTVLGLDGGPLSNDGRMALSAARLVVGGKRHLASVTELIPPTADVVVTGPLVPALDTVSRRSGPAVVLASGDPSWFGIVRALRERGIEPRVLPGVSSVAQLAARLGVPREGIATVSAHGRDPRPALNAARALPAVAVLTGPDFTVAELAAGLEGWDRVLAVGELLGHDGERVTRCSTDEAAGRTWHEPNVVLVTDPARPGGGLRWHDQPAMAPSGGWALPETAFAHRDAMVTKAEVRAAVLARLAPSLGRLLWDVGAGSGSVGVECARMGAAVIAVERDAGACADVETNAGRHRVSVRIVHGAAPAVLDVLPSPDACFVGGGGPEVVTAVAQLAVPRIVVACAALEHATASRAALRGAGYTVDGVQLSAGRLVELPDGSARLTALNPVIVLWADRGSAFPDRPAEHELHDRRGLHDRGEGGEEE